MSDQSFTYDRWAAPDDPEFVVVRVGDLRKIERACWGIWAIARILGIGASGTETTEQYSPDKWAVLNLTGGVESLCEQLVGVVEAATDGTNTEVLAR